MDNNKNYRIIEEGWIVYKVVDGWVIDTYGNNYASIERWGSEAAAIESLKTLKNCFSCVDCWYCKNCRFCTECEGCTSVSSKVLAFDPVGFMAMVVLDKDNGN